MDASKFVSSLSQFADNQKSLASFATSDSILSLFRNLVLQTPIDTTRCQSNWNLSLGSPNSSFFETLQDGGSSALRSAEESLFSQEVLKEGAKVYISNSTPYIYELENGHSRQQPTGWIFSEVSRFQNGIGYFGNSSSLPSAEEGLYRRIAIKNSGASRFTSNFSSDAL